MIHMSNNTYTKQIFTTQVSNYYSDICVCAPCARENSDFTYTPCDYTYDPNTDAFDTLCFICETPLTECGE